MISAARVRLEPKTATEVYARLQWILCQINKHFALSDGSNAISELRRWSKNMGLSLPDYSEVTAAAANASSMRGKPFTLSQQELLQILCSAK